MKLVEENMEKYYFTQNVYMINGAKRSCIYDLNSGNLYSLNGEARQTIEYIIGGQDTCPKSVTLKEIENFINVLLERHLISLKKLPHIKSENYDSGIEFAWIEVTKRCNLKCIHCYNPKEALSLKSNRADMTYDEFCRAVDVLVKSKVRSIQIIGGEPLVLGKTLIKMLDYAKDKFKSITIFTNGTLMNEEFIDSFKKTKVKHVAFSIYSYLDKDHDRVTKVEKSLDKTKKAIELMKKNHIEFRAANVRMKHISIGEKNTDLFDLNEKYDFVRLSGRGNLNLYDKEQLRKKLITKEKFQNKVSSKFFEKAKNQHNCFGTKVYIDINLNVYPCVMERRICHGNIREKVLQDIIKEEIRELNKDKVQGCKHCEYRYACFDCRPDAITHNTNEKPWYCTYDPYLGQWCDIDEFIKELEEKLC